jgi:Uma2 family endonuclease
VTGFWSVLGGIALAVRARMRPGYSRTVMRAAMVPESMLEERRRRGHDRFDEVWQGVLHMVPPPSFHHQRIERRLLILLSPIAERRGLEVVAGLFHPGVADSSDYRQPDLAIAGGSALSKRGVEGRVHLVIEILSKHDESRAKLPFYAEVGVAEVWLVDPHRFTVEVIGSSVLGISVEVIGTTLWIIDGDNGERHAIELTEPA